MVYQELYYAIIIALRPSNKPCSKEIRRSTKRSFSSMLAGSSSQADYDIIYVCVQKGESVLIWFYHNECAPPHATWVELCPEKIGQGLVILQMTPIIRYYLESSRCCHTYRPGQLISISIKIFTPISLSSLYFSFLHQFHISAAVSHRK